MKDSSLSHGRETKLKLLVSFNGAFYRRPHSRKLGYVGGETHIISVERSISFQILKSKIMHFFCPGANFVQFCLKYHVLESFCGDNGGGGGEEEKPALSLLESDDDLRCMIEEYESRELEGKPVTRVWIFVCNAVNSVGFDDKYSVVNVSSGDWYCGKNNKGFVKFIGVDPIHPNGDNKRESQNLFFIFNKYGNKSKKIGDDSLRKMVLKQQLLAKNLGGIRSSCSSMDHQSENGISVSRPKQLLSELESRLSSESNNLNVCGDIQSSDKISPAEESTSCFQNSKDGNLHMGRQCSIGNLLGNRNDHYILSSKSNQFVHAAKSRTMPFNYSINWMVNGLNPNCELGIVDHREDTVPPSVDCNVAKRGLVPTTCHHLMGIGDCIHIYGSGKARYQRACPYRISARSNANESGKHQNYRLERKKRARRYYLRIKSSSNISNQGPTYRSWSSAPGQEIQRKQGTVVDNGHVLNPPYCGEELYKSVGHGVPQQGTANSEDCQLVHDGGNGSLLPMSNPLSSSGVEKIDNAKCHISETSLKPQSNGSDLMDKQQNNLGSNEKSRGTNSDASQCNISDCDDYDDKMETVQHNRKSDSSSTGKDKNMKTASCLKGIDDIPANIIALYAHLAKKELQIIRNSDLEYTEELGHGTYGTVYHGKWKGSDVAIKGMKPTCSSKDEQLVADFWKEAHTLSQLNHPNIVGLYGVVTDGPVNCLATVTEYMVNGSLKQVLHRKDRTIDCRKRMIIAMDAAFGMEYLHGKNIVHFDLKSHNFLVNMRDPQRPVCKIGDLGSSKVKQRTLVSGGVRGTIPWMAPELLSRKNLVSEKVDVFSFGIVMWELLTCEEPYAKMRFMDIIAGIVRGNLRPEIPNWCDPSWRFLMERCWSSNPDFRPSFSEIAKELRAMAASMNIK